MIGIDWASPSTSHLWFSIVRINSQGEFEVLLTSAHSGRDLIGQARWSELQLSKTTSFTAPNLD